MTESNQSEATTVRRIPRRGAYDAATIHDILDQGMVCHVGFVADSKPFVIPTTYVRVGDERPGGCGQLSGRLDGGRDECCRLLPVAG